MPKLRQRFLQKRVLFKDVEQEKKRKAAQRVGNLVRYGNTIFELHESREDSIYCTLLEVRETIGVLAEENCGAIEFCPNFETFARIMIF